MSSIRALTTTCIGSVPFLDVEETLDLIAGTCPDLPCWPQFSLMAVREDMSLQAADGLPLLEVDEENRRITVSEGPREEALTEFYEHFLSGDYDYFAVPPHAEVGFTALLNRIKTDPVFDPEYVKAQITGPVSFGSNIRTPDEKTLVDDPELWDTLIKGLAAKGAWAARRIRETGKKPVVFIDEPGLTGFGSAFSTLSREKVVDGLGEMIEILKTDGDVLVGSHVCGNTDWGMIIDSGVDMVNFDAYDYLEQFLLYPEKIKSLLDRGGYVVWGIVPTLKYNGKQTAEELADHLWNGWRILADKGVDLELIRSRALISPACGVGAVKPDMARGVYELLPAVADLMKGKSE